MADISYNAKAKLTALLAAQARGDRIAEINVSNCNNELGYNPSKGMGQVPNSHEHNVNP